MENRNIEKGTYRKGGKMTKEIGKCETCMFWDREDFLNREKLIKDCKEKNDKRQFPGEALYYPPYRGGACRIRSVEKFPLRLPEDWCGEWREEDGFNTIEEAQRQLQQDFDDITGVNPVVKKADDPS